MNLTMEVSVDLRFLEQKPDRVVDLLNKICHASRKNYLESWYQSYSNMCKEYEDLKGKALTPAITRRWDSLAMASYYVRSYGRLELLAPIMHDREERLAVATHIHNTARVQSDLGRGTSTVRYEWDLERKKKSREVFKQKGTDCFYCGSPEAKSVDHLIPVCRGGSNHIENLVPCCRSCNSKKGAKTQTEYAEYLERQNNGA